MLAVTVNLNVNVVTVPKGILVPRLNRSANPEISRKVQDVQVALLANS